MGKTVVAVFEKQQDAELALEGLTGAGFTRDTVRITSTGSGIADASSSQLSQDENQTLGEKIAGFFGFGDDEKTYSEAVRRGNCVLTVDAADDAKADLAESVIYRFDPVDIDQRAAEWREGGRQPAMKSGSETEETAIPVSAEQQEVGEREVRKGGVRIISRSIARPAGPGGSNGGRADLSQRSFYTGPERRRPGNAHYSGVERRAA